MRRTREAARIALLGAGLPVASLASAAAQDPHSEIFTGLEASNNAISGYLGAGHAFGKGLYERGWRVRAVGALGRYDYRGTLFGAGADLGKTFDGEASYGAALIGYQFRTQALFLKLFAGVEAEDQSITPRDSENSVQGGAVGLKLAAESWLDLSPLWFLGAWRGRAIAFRHASNA
ncbi:cellulose biosynthesis protein BcsS [Methyloceanibacter sp.]|uniref:cellulose biosynthesis protein BcsS n=1 Tax=Methyloceanibacter sp. TaxID=1965321 RepID=UPI003C76C31A